MRNSLFRAGIVADALSAVAATVDWTVPFPLVAESDGNRGISPWDDRVFLIGLVLRIATIALAAFGRGRLRSLLMAAGLFLLALSVVGFAQNHI